MSSYLVFTEDKDYSKGRKTKRWILTSMRGANLGSILWYPAWRQYCFFPSKGTIFNHQCLFEIQKWCMDKTAEHREMKTQQTEREME